MIAPPIEPMLAKLADVLPADRDYLYEPKWDGFRAIVFRSASDVFIQSRDLKPLDRYFPDLHEALLAQLPRGCVVDGEIVITTPHGLDFDALQMRLHPAASRVAKLAQATPASFVAFDVLAAGGRNAMGAPQHERRALLGKKALASHPWQAWAQAEAGSARMPGAQSRWSAGKDLSWEPLRVERVCEVKYDHLQGDRFRHAATFLRWRPDKEPRDCRYDQLEVTPAYELSKVFSSGSRRS